MFLGSVSGRSARRRTEAGFLLDGLRSEICTERGTSSDRRRRRLGLPLSRTPAEILGIDDLDLNDFSPMAARYRPLCLIVKSSGWGFLVGGGTQNKSVEVTVY